MPRRPATRARKALRVSETSIHLQVARFLRLAWPAELPWFHAPNGERRDAGMGGKLKAMGVLAGVPDFTFIMPNGQAAFLELKAAGGHLSDVQIEFRDRVIALRCGYAVARSLDEAETVFAGWLAAYGLRLKARTAGAAAPLFQTQGAA